MKKLMLISLTIALMLAVSGCLAESIFAPLEDTTVAALSLTAPSYGAMANVAEDQVEQNAEAAPSSPIVAWTLPVTTASVSIWEVLVSL